MVLTATARWSNAVLMTMVLVAAQVSGAQAQSRNWPSSRAPKPLPASGVTFPPYEVKSLNNGLTVVAVEQHEQPAISVRLIVRAGSAQEPPDKPGIAGLTAALLDQGTGSKSAQEIAETIDYVGGGLGTGAGADLSFVSEVVMKDDFDLGLNLLSEVVREPTFTSEELERQREQLLSGLRVSYQDPDYVADVVFDRLVYGFHPYGRPNDGTPESGAAITRDDVVAFHQAFYVPNNCLLAIVGDITTKEAFAGAERVLGDWPAREAPTTTFADPPEPTRRVIVVDKPGAVQTEIRVGHIGLARKNRDYMAMNLAVKVLGGEGANRLQRVLRTERGLTYGAEANLDTLKQSGDVVAKTDTRSETTAQVARLIIDEFWRLQRERVVEGELADAQAYLAGSFPLTIETPDAIALQVLNVLFYELSLDELQTFRERVQAVRVDDIWRVARAYLKPDRLSIVLVGDASSFVDDLRGVGLGKYERVPLTDLDLAAVDFKRDRRAAPQPAPQKWNEPGGDGVASATRASAQDANEPRALVERAVRAMGGLDALKGIRTVVAKGDTILPTPEGPVTAPTVTFVEYPLRFRVEAELPVGKMVQAYADGSAWLETPNGVVDPPPEMREEFSQSVQRDLIALLRRSVTDALTLRRLPDATDEDGTRLGGVEFSASGLSPVALYFDPETGLVAKETYFSKGPSGSVTTEEVYSDYRSVDGVKMPFKAVIRREGTQVIERRLSEVRVNTTINPALFEKPRSEH